MGTFFYDLNKRLNELAAPKETLNEGTGVTDYNPKSQGGTRKELVAKYHKTRDPQDAAAARRAGATQKELKGVAEGSCGSMGEAGYSAKAARAGRDIGRPGKQFAKIAKGAAERYGSEERGEKVAGAVLKKLRAKQSVEESDMDEEQLDEFFHFDLPPGKDRGPRDHGTDELARRAEVSKRTKRPIAMDPSYKDKDQYGDMYKIAGPKGRLPEGEMGEGNEFSGALAQARKTGSATFRVDGKTYKVTEAELDEREFDDKEKFDRQGKPGDTYRGHKGTVTKTRSGETHRRRHEEEPESDRDDDDDKPKTKGRPKGTRRAIGAKGPTGRSKLLKKDAIKETDVEEDYDRDEYDEEGEMAKSQSRTIADAAMELQDMLGDNENLPEWVQKKINLAMDYIDAVRDYLKANRPEDDMVAEKAVSQAQRAAAGIARAAQKGDIPQSKLRGASKAMAKMPAGELKKFATTKEKGLPKKKEVEETTTAGSVAPAADTPKKSKGGMQYGKGIYDSFDRAVENLIAESMNVSMNVSSEGQNSVTVTATDEDAAKLASLLKMAGIGGAMAGDDHACPSCGGSPCGCAEQVDENQPDWPTNTETSADALQYSGGLNRPKSTGQTTAPIVASQIDRVEPEDDEDDLARLREMAGISEAAKPDFLDVDKDGDKKEPMKKAAKEKEHDDEEVKESILDMTRLWKAYQG